MLVLYGSFLPSSILFIGTKTVFPPGCCSTSALFIWIFLFIRARLYIGGVLLLEESPSQLLEAVDYGVFGDLERLLPGPTEASSF